MTDLAATVYLAVVSPDGKREVFRRGHDLWLRSLPDGEESLLTLDGTADHEYGTAPFSPDVLLKKLGITHLPPAVAWSPDSSKILTHQLDQRAVREMHMIDVTTDQPELYTQRLPYPADDKLPMVKLVEDGFLWYSQRDGWGHLYRYDLSGELRNQVTSGEWAVQRILRVDAGVVYFVATGLVASNPYRKTVCRIGLDGTGFERLTADSLDLRALREPPQVGLLRPPPAPRRAPGRLPPHPGPDRPRAGRRTVQLSLDVTSRRSVSSDP